MAALIIALFVIVAVWGWFLVPKKTGAHRSSSLSIRGRRFKPDGQRTRSGPTPEVTAIPVAGMAKGRVAVVPAGAGTGPSARRRRVRAVLIGAAVVSLAAALYTTSMTWWWTHLAVDGLLVIYYGLWMQWQEGRAIRVSPSISRTEQESRPALRKVVGG